MPAREPGSFRPPRVIVFGAVTSAAGNASVSGDWGPATASTESKIEGFCPRSLLFTAHDVTASYYLQHMTRSCVVNNRLR